MIATATLLGKGIYTPSEAAVYARLSSQTLNRWMFGNSKGEPVVFPQVANDDERIVTFLDFVQLLAIRDIRTKHNVDLGKLRDAVMIARERGIEYPFAVQHKTFLFGDTSTKGHGEVVLNIDGQLIQASGLSKRNLVMREVAELYLRDLYFDPKSGLAAYYHPFGESLNRAIVMNPKIRFGEPIVASCGYTAETLLDAYKVEGSVQAAAAAHGVSEADIDSALRYYDLLLSNKAA